MRFTGTLRRRLRSIAPTRSHPATTVHFLHVSKAAGTQIGQVIKQINSSSFERKFVKHGHEVALFNLPQDQDYFFSVRDPVSRFKSGFYSRQRKGQPRYYNEWSEQERLAFENFPHANDLAEALFTPGQRGREAVAAIRAIQHCSRNLVDWFKFHGHMFEIRPPIWILRQEHFARDLGVFLKRCGYEGTLELAADKTRSHANDYSGIPELSDRARENLRRWYVQDYAFLDLCQEWMATTDPTC